MVKFMTSGSFTGHRAKIAFSIDYTGRIYGSEKKKEKEKTDS